MRDLIGTAVILAFLFVIVPLFVFAGSGGM